MENIFINEGTSPLFGFIIISVFSIITKKGNHQIVSFIEVGQYKLLSRQSIYFLSEGLYKLAYFFSYTAALRLIFHSWSNVG